MSSATLEQFSSATAQYVDVIAEQLGGRIVSFSDQFFADAENLIKPKAPIREVKFVPTGAWFDGWETRRHNKLPADWVVIKFGVDSARLIGCEIDTAFFNGNHAPEIMVEAAFVESDAELASASWHEIISRRDCGPSQRQFFLTSTLTDQSYTHVRLNMYPDGGIARFRLYGEPVAVFPADKTVSLDLAHVSNGGVAVAFSDQHFGTANNLLLPGRGFDMSDGWETKRSRGNHVDWVVVRLGAEAVLDRIVVDTKNFLGNFPESVVVEATKFEGSVPPESVKWTEIVGRSETKADQEHEFAVHAGPGQSFTHVKLTIIPDGGVKRFRVFGRRV